MSRRLMSAGSAGSDLLWFVAIMTTLGIIWYATGGPSRPEAWQGLFIEPPSPIGTGEIYGASRPPLPAPTVPITPFSYQYRATSLTEPPLVARSPWYDQVRIDSGSGQYEIQPNQEYITLEANYNNSAPITVTGWSLTNGKSQPDGVIIPYGTRLFIGDSANLPNMPIILAPEARLVLTTGRMPNSDPYVINANFLVNKCSGYLDALPQYRFTPALYSSCPAPIKEPGVDGLENDCYKFVSRLSSCHTPKVERNADGYEFIDRVSGLSSYCRSFLEEHFNYNSCVKWHEQDTDFYGDEWRAYLGRTWELWSENRETITLYDQQGKIVAQENY
ncbi:MAG TPA: hypothetical protein VJB69_03260 [Candidatus Paceibacterota bacterium]